VSELLSLAIQPGTRRTVVRVRGEIDLATAPKLRECLAGLAGDLVVDLSDVSFVDSQAIGLLLAEHHRREKIGDCLIVCGASAMAMRTFEVTGAVKLLNLEDEAPGDPRSEPAASVSRHCNHWRPGRSMRAGKFLSGGAAVAGHGARAKARTAMNSTTNLRTTNPLWQAQPPGGAEHRPPRCS